MKGLSFKMLRLIFMFLIIFITASNSQQALKCDFEGAAKNSTDLPCKCDGNNCLLEQIQTDQIDWLAWQGSTPSSGTGPEVDHTFRTEDGFYIYFETSNQPPYTEAIIKTPKLDLGEISCLRFWYHMYGQHTGSLDVKGTFSDGTTSSLWKLRIEPGDVWREGVVLLLPNVEYISFVASKDYHGADKPHGDTALDDITIKRELCAGLTPPPGYTTSSSTTTTTITTKPTIPTETNTSKTDVSLPSSTNDTSVEVPKPEPATDSLSLETTAGTIQLNSEFAQEKGLSSNLTIVIAVLVVAVTVVTVVILVLRHRKHITMTAKQNANSDRQSHQQVDNQNGEYEDVDDITPSITGSQPPQTPQYEHIDKVHVDYENSITTGPYAEIHL